MSRKMVLGRGLDALIPSGAGTAVQNPGGRILQVPIDRIRPNPRQPRTWFDDARLDELAKSIADKGIIEPLIVRPAEAGHYELVAGERRLRAAQKAGLTEVPAVERAMDARDSLEIALIENLQREDINPVDEARAYQRLAEEFGHTHAEISELVGKDRSTVTNLLRILRLPPDVLEHVSRGTLSAGHARVLISIESPTDASLIAQRIMDEGWSVRQAESLVNKIKSRASRKPRGDGGREKAKDKEVLRVEEALRYALGTEVRLHHGPTGGRIEICYSDTEELERLLSVLGVQVH